jgi:hypothetical protein
MPAKIASHCTCCNIDLTVSLSGSAQIAAIDSYKVDVDSILCLFKRLVVSIPHHLVEDRLGSYAVMLDHCDQKLGGPVHHHHHGLMSSKAINSDRCWRLSLAKIVGRVILCDVGSPKFMGGPLDRSRSSRLRTFSGLIRARMGLSI